jgi:SAM-dependent methyltransferase
MGDGVWDRLGHRKQPSWYLAPEVARQKRELNLGLIHRWAAGAPQRILKTDLFEEAFGEDQLLGGLFPPDRGVYACDVAHTTARAAALRFPELAGGLLVMDVRRPAFREASLDLIISTSTLDHFASREEFRSSLAALAGMLRPGGRLILTLDNPLNPLLAPLRWYTRWRRGPFPLGYTPFLSTLRRDLEGLGLTVEAHDWLIHNPRGFSTALFLILRRLLGRRATAPISCLLAIFNLLDRLPTRRFTACFQAVAARKGPRGREASETPLPSAAGITNEAKRARQFLVELTESLRAAARRF